jgi:transcription elongation factor GreA
MSSIEQARQLIADGAFDKLDDLWTDLITDDSVELKQYLSITDALKAKGELEQASLLLELLSEHYESRKELRNAIEIQKSLLRFHEESPQIRRKIIELYRRQWSRSEHFDDYLQLSGLNSDEPIMKAINLLDEYLTYDVGRYFFFERYGLGKVVAVVPQKREIVIDFERKQRHFLSIDVARGLLTPIDTEHFLYLKHEQPARLRSLAQEQPAEVVVMLLRSIREPMNASKIKGFLEGIVEQTQLNRFWEKTRKVLEKHDNIRVAGKTSKTYSYVGSAADKENQAIEAFHNAKLRDKYGLAEEYAKKMPKVFTMLIPHLAQLGKKSQKDHPGIALDILTLLRDGDADAALGYSMDDLLELHKPEEILKETTNSQSQDDLISCLKERTPDKWLNVTADILLATGDFKVMDAAVDRMRDAPDKLAEVYHRILTMPKEYPRQFYWMLKKIESGALKDYLRPNLVPRFIDSLQYVQGVTATVKRILALKTFDAMIARAEVNEAQRIRDSVKISSALTEHEKSGYIRIIEHYFPTLAEERTDIIYATKTALARRKRELDHILTIEIPANKKEISRAREFGDLSENFEYKAAKEKQDQLYAKVKSIESELLNTQMIDPAEIDTAVVNVGTTIKLQNAKGDSIVSYTIMGRWDTDLSSNTISNEAPLAQTMLGKKCGDTVKMEGIEYRIIEIKRAL